MLESKNNAEYEILTPTGWSGFSHVKRNKQNNLIKIIFEDNSSIICTLDHLFKIENTFIKASEVTTGSILTGKKVWSTSSVAETVYVYDVVNVTRNREYYTNGVVSHNCTFLGSAGTLISSAALKSMAFSRPIRELMDGLEIYEEPQPNHFYVSSVDSSRGQGLDYSAFLVFDCTVQPFKVVAKYRNNTISPMLFPNVIVQTAKYFNEAYLLIENNDVGAQVADLCMHELEYDNMFHGEEANGRFYLGQHGRAKQLGIKTTKRVKRQGCNALKQLVEAQKILIQDFNIIEELSTFILRRDGTYAAEEGAHDDLAMCMVLFSWLSAQSYFRDMTNFDIRQKLYAEKMRAIEDDLPPLPAGDDDIDNNPKYFRHGEEIWEVVDDYQYKTRIL